jgi:hypothetical protein
VTSAGDPALASAALAARDRGVAVHAVLVGAATAGAGELARAGVAVTAVADAVDVASALAGSEVRAHAS